MTRRAIIPMRFGSARWHRDAVRSSGQLTLIYRQMYQPQAPMITPLDVIKLLNKAKLKFILMGTHGVGGYRSVSRATDDIDLLVRLADLPKAIKAIQTAYPELVFQDFAVVARFKDPVTDKPVIDLMKPTQDVFKMAFRHSVSVKTHRIPSLEMALVSKFAAMTSPNREQAKKLIDGGDFVDIVVSNLKKINRSKLRRLADKVYPDGGAEIIEMIDDIAAGRRIRF
jgi:hypothetical protein